MTNFHICIICAFKQFNVAFMSIQIIMTTRDGLSPLFIQQGMLTKTFQKNNNPTIFINSDITYQPIEGFGYSLTDGSAMLMDRLTPDKRTKLLRELFSNDQNSIKVSYLRTTIGASDLSTHAYSYNDVPFGEKDPDLNSFDMMAGDSPDTISVLRKILKINPDLKIMATPWSAPAWMKTNISTIAGQLRPEYYAVYANYFIKYIKAMKENGIHVHSITVQNEPHNPKNNPSMIMSSKQQTKFIGEYLGPAMVKNNINTKILCWDHNCDKPEYAISVLNDPTARKYIDGSAFHLYNGTPEVLSKVQAAHPDKKLYLTEQWTGANGNYGDDLVWHARHVVIGALRNHARAILEWNLASDPSCKPHTAGGEPHCVGALTIDGQKIKRNVSHDIIAHVSKFIPPDSLRIDSNDNKDYPNVAFLKPDGSYAMLVLNDSGKNGSFNIVHKERQSVINIKAEAFCTLNWQ